MNLEELREAAQRFRSAIEFKSNSLGPTFTSFPSGSCGDASILLGTYLTEIGFGEFKYMLGEYGEGNSWSSHAWIQQNELIVDITLDQFPENDVKVFVSCNSEWHRKLNGESSHRANYRIYDPITVGQLACKYNRIKEVLNAT